MAFIGMRHVVMAAVSAHTDGAEPTYSDGMDVGKAISANLTINRNNNPLYADDAIAEDDNGITGMELEIGTDDLEEDVQDAMGLIKKVTSGSGTSAVTTYYNTTASAKPVGIGYLRVRRKNGATKYQAIWVYKAVFGMTNENAATKGESIEWQTPTVTGRCAGLSIDSSGEKTFRKIRVFDTESDANSWLDTCAGITRTGNGG